jgi:hypothetical protein
LEWVLWEVVLALVSSSARIAMPARIDVLMFLVCFVANAAMTPNVPMGNVVRMNLVHELSAKRSNLPLSVEMARKKKERLATMETPWEAMVAVAPVSEKPASSKKISNTVWTKLSGH